MAGGDVRIGSSHLAGSGLILSSSSLACAGVWDGSYTFYPNTCP